MGSSYKRIAAIKTTIDILRCLADQKQPAAGQDISRATGAPYATIMCHLVTLADEHMVRQVGDAWELDMGLALFWARYKAQTEGKILKLTHELQTLEV